MGDKYDIASLKMSSNDRYLRTPTQTNHSITDVAESTHIAFTNTTEEDTDARKRIVWGAQKYGPLSYRPPPPPPISGSFRGHFPAFAFGFEKCKGGAQYDVVFASSTTMYRPARTAYVFSNMCSQLNFCKYPERLIRNWELQVSWQTW